MKTLGRRQKLVMWASHRIAAHIRPTLQSAFLAGIRRARQELPLADLEAVIHTGDVHRVLNAIPWAAIDERMTERFRGAFQRAFEDAARAHADIAPVRKAQDLGFSLAFDETNPLALRWALENAAGTVTGISEETRAALRQLIARMFIEGIPPAKAARMMRDLLGLTPRLAVAAVNYRLTLERDPERDPEQGARMADRYETRLLNFRAEQIARTESMRASNAGQDELWRQAIDNGQLDKEHTQRQWLITPDERLCPVCASIADAGPVDFGQPFVSDDGQTFDQPPAHVSCRCTLRLVFTD